MPSPSASSRLVRIVGVGSCLGAPISGPAAGPRALRALGLDSQLRRRGIAAQWEVLFEPPAAPLPPPPLAQRLTTMGALLHELATTVAGLCAAGTTPLVLGGDHAIGAGTWRGVAHALAPQGPLGLLWIDAHLDAHTPLTSHTGNIHGMPLAALLGVGDERLTGLPGPHLDPARVAIVGVRSWEAEELSLLAGLGVRIYFMPEVRTLGLAAVLDEALQHVRAGSAGFGVSLDLDAVDCAQLPATTCLEPDGLDPRELAEALGRLHACPDLQALEIVEYVPERDADGSGAQWVAEFAAAVLGPPAAAGG